MLKVGDRVRIKQGANLYRDGRSYAWSMNGNVGEEFTITTFHDFHKDAPVYEGCYYAPEWLELISEDKEETMNIKTFFKLSSEQRELYKAGLITEGGDLTSDAKDILLEEMAKDEKILKNLLIVAKEFNKANKSK